MEKSQIISVPKVLKPDEHIIYIRFTRKPMLEGGFNYNVDEFNAGELDQLEVAKLLAKMASDAVANFQTAISRLMTETGIVHPNGN